MTRDAWINIQLNNLKDNIDKIESLTGKIVFPVVKANAYGHGDVEVSRFMIQQQAPFLCVSSLDEALYLSKHGIDNDILIFGYVNPIHIRDKHKPNFVYTVTSMAWYESFKLLNIKARLHVEVNSGMNRVGFKNINDILKIMETEDVEGIYTHFQTLTDLKRSEQQNEVFIEVLKQLPYIPKWVHLGNAPVEIIKNNKWVNACRVGLGMYGYRDDIEGLKPVLSLYASIIHTDFIKKDETLGYDETYTADKDEWFGTIPLGYADGLSMNQNSYPVFINNEPYQIVGKICMDQLMIRSDQPLHINDIAEFIGPNRTIPKLNESTNISMYILLTSLSARIERRYYENETLITVVNR